MLHLQFHEGPFSLPQAEKRPQLDQLQAWIIHFQSLCSRYFHSPPWEFACHIVDIYLPELLHQPLNDDQNQECKDQGL